MGGNLFKLGRLPKARYLEIEAEISVYLDARFGDLYRIPRYYSAKPDFGDLDIILSDAAVETSWEDLRQNIANDLGIAETKLTGHVFSTVFRDFQVDYFLRPEASFIATYNFLCFNDLGNLLGKIFRRLGLKYGEEGLEYVFRRENGHYRRDLIVCRDIERILDFIGLDHETWVQGFDTLELMYAWVSQSPWFSVEPYLNQSATTRKRARLRPTIERFLVWLDTEGITTTCDYEADKTAYLPRIEAAFPEAGLLQAIAAERELEARDTVIRSRFNGRLVMSLFPHLKGEALGIFIRTFKEGFEDFEAAIYEMSPEEIRRRLLKHGEQG